MYKYNILECIIILKKIYLSYYIKINNKLKKKKLFKSTFSIISNTYYNLIIAN